MKIYIKKKKNNSEILAANEVCILPLNPTNPRAIASLSFGPITQPMRKLSIAATIIAIKKFCTFISHSMPTAQIIIIIAKATVPIIRVSFTPLSIILTPKLSVTIENEKRSIL